MKKKKAFYFALSILALSFGSCHNDDDDNDNNDDIIPPSNVIEITSNITTATTWLDGKIYLIKKYDFYVEASLTIQGGAIIKFHPTLGPYMMLGTAGTVIANGSASKPIIFTSYKDDSHGGDTNADGTATTPASKDWGYVNTNGMNGSIFNYCEFYYGGNDSYSTTLSVESNSSATVTNCTFAHNDGNDASGGYGVLDASNASAATVIQGNIFYDNIRPLSINTLFSLDNSNVFHNPANNTQTNTYNGIFVESINEVTSNITWSEKEVAYVIDDNDFWIDNTFHLTLADSVVLKFLPSSEIVLANGSSSIVNYNGSGVYFTSFKDDTKKGDTNGDGSVTTPANSDWEGIYDDQGSAYVSWSSILYDNH